MMAVPRPAPAVPAATPLTINTRTPAYGAVRAMTVQDLSDPSIMTWLLPKLRTRWPEVTPYGLIGWLRGFMASNLMTLAVVGTRAVGCAQITRDGLDPAVRAEVLFGFIADGSETAAHELYRHFARWAKTRRAVELRYDRDTDLTERSLDALMATLGELKGRRSRHVILE